MNLGQEQATSSYVVLCVSFFIIEVIPFKQSKMISCRKENKIIAKNKSKYSSPGGESVEISTFNILKK